MAVRQETFPPRVNGYELTGKLYLQQMAEIPVLKPEQERACFQDLEKGKLASLLLGVRLTGDKEIRIDPDHLNDEDSKKSRKQRKEGEGKKARILGETAVGFIQELGLDGKVGIETKEEEVSENDPDGKAKVNVLQGLIIYNPQDFSSAIDRERLERIKQKGTEARMILIDSNLRWVVKIVNRIAKSYERLEDLDRVQEGNVGLMTAVDKFEWWRGLKFSTFATWWIKQAITRAKSIQELPIRVPDNKRYIIDKVFTAREKFIQEQGREPTLEELAERLHMKVEAVLEYLEIGQRRDLVSLDREIHNGEGREITLAEFIKDSGPSVEEIVEASDLKGKLDQLMIESGLTERERKVLRLRFGIQDDRDHTLKELGREFRISGERVRRIEKTCIEKIRQAVADGKNGDNPRRLVEDYL